jgi:hypothetical protein
MGCGTVSEIRRGPSRFDAGWRSSIVVAGRSDRSANLDACNWPLPGFPVEDPCSLVTNKAGGPATSGV